MTPERLKLSILQYAMQGKLVEQRLEEGTGYELLEQIKIEKDRLLREKKIKKSVTFPENNEEMLFEIPDSWEWVHLNNIAESNLGKTLNKSTDIGKEVEYLCSINVYWEGINLEKVKTAKFDEQSKEKYKLKKGDLLICEGGDAGRSAIWNSDKEMYYQNALHRVRFLGDIDPKYICFCLEYYKKSGIINNYTKGISIQHLVQSSLNRMWFPLPPIEEQHRIVAKIEKLLPLIDKYDSSWTKLEKLNIEFSDKMKKSILQYAIQGKLVEQKLEEGTAEELYKKIQEEKNKLIQEGKIKKQKELAEIKEDEIPFDIPDTWKWVKLGTLFFIERGASPRPIKAYLTKNADGVNWIKIGDSEAGAKYITTTSEKITYEGAKKSRKVEIGDFIISNSMSFGRPYIMAIDGYVHDGWNILHFISDNDGNDLIYKDYIYYLLSSSLLKQQIVAKVAGGVVKNIKTDNLKELIIPLPPYKEQKRISKKIEEMLRYCN